MKTNSIPAGLVVDARTLAAKRLAIFRRTWLWTGFLALAAIAFGPRPAQAAVAQAWVQRYGSQVGSESEDSAHKVVTDAAGNVIVAGSTDNRTGRGADMLVIKYSGEGVPLWEKIYNGPADGDDVAWGLAVDDSGNVVVTGQSANTNNNYDYYTAKYAAADGALLWENGYNGPANSHAGAVALDGSGNVFVTGRSIGSGGNDDYVTIAYSGAGVPLWTNRYDGPANGYVGATAVAVDGGGKVFVTGSSYVSGGHWDYATIAYSGAGVALWTNRYGGLGSGLNSASGVAVDGRGNVFVTGSSYGSGSSSDYATIAYSGAGVALWTNRYNGPANGYDAARAVAVDGSGNVFVTGYSVGSGSGSDYATIAYSGAGVPLWTNRYNRPAINGDDYAGALTVDGSGNVFVTGDSSPADYATIAYSGAGVPLWTNHYNGPANEWDVPTAVAVDGSGNVFVTGSSYVGGGHWDYATVAYSSAGVALWTNRYGGQRAASDVASAAAVDGSGNVFLTGSSVGSGGNYDYATIAYSSAGVPLWTNRYNGNGYDIASAVAVDGSGNVFMTGSSEDNDGDRDYATIAYSGSGVPLWTNRYDGPWNATDEATAMAVDGSGKVFVTGGSNGNGGNSDYATIAYSDAGVALWTNRYDGGNGEDAASAMAVDDSGNVFVTGSSFGNGGNYDYATIAYSGAGVALWTNRYNGPDNGNDQATAVAVDGSGNVFVTGSSPGTGGDWDFATIAYSGVGVPLWTNHYNGPDNGSDQATSVAVDGSGNVFVTGSSFGNGGNYDYATIAYSGAGVPLWTNRYDGGNGHDGARAMAVDGSGNVFVTGSSLGSQGDSDFATVKYVWRTEIAIQLLSAIPPKVNLTLSGAPNSSWAIERALEPTGPWTNLNTLVIGPNGSAQLQHTNSPHPAGFYRARQQ